MKRLTSHEIYSPLCVLCASVVNSSEGTND